jgi:hypothetical protein
MMWSGGKHRNQYIVCCEFRRLAYVHIIVLPVGYEVENVSAIEVYIKIIGDSKYWNKNLLFISMAIC